MNESERAKIRELLSSKRGRWGTDAGVWINWTEELLDDADAAAATLREERAARAALAGEGEVRDVQQVAAGQRAYFARAVRLEAALGDVIAIFGERPAGDTDAERLKDTEEQIQRARLVCHAARDADPTDEPSPKRLNAARRCAECGQRHPGGFAQVWVCEACDRWFCPECYDTDRHNVNHGYKPVGDVLRAARELFVGYVSQRTINTGDDPVSRATRAVVDAVRAWDNARVASPVEREPACGNDLAGTSSAAEHPLHATIRNAPTRIEPATPAELAALAEVERDPGWVDQEAIDRLIAEKRDGAAQTHETGGDAAFSGDDIAEWDRRQRESRRLTREEHLTPPANRAKTHRWGCTEKVCVFGCPVNTYQMPEPSPPPTEAAPPEGGPKLPESGADLVAPLEWCPRYPPFSQGFRWPVFFVGGRSMTPERLKWYQAMIADEVRERAFRKALEQRARGRTIVDVGSGFGHLSLYALQAGAEHCYLIERDKEAVERSRLLLDSNGFADEYTIVHGDCRRVELGRVGDVVMSETLDVCGAGEGTIEILNNASRFLKPGGVIMPAGLELHVALLYIDTGLPLGKLACVDLDGELAWFDWVPGAYKPVFAQRTGTVYALAFAFTAKLVPGVHLTNLPGFPKTHWRQGVLPLEPFSVREGDRFMIKAEIFSAPESESEQCNISYELAKIQGG